jgi:hypothetical protein
VRRLEIYRDHPASSVEFGELRRIPNHPDPVRRSLIRVVRTCRLPRSAVGDRQQRLTGLWWVNLVGVAIRRRDHCAVPIKNEGRSRFADRKLRQEFREPRVFDDDAENALTFAIDVDRACQRD